jgi:hypothetical protein
MVRLDFDQAKFLLEPSEEALQDLKKDELIALAKHLDLKVKKAWRKQEIRSIIVKYLVGSRFLKNQL